MGRISWYIRHQGIPFHFAILALVKEEGEGIVKVLIAHEQPNCRVSAGGQSRAYEGQREQPHGAGCVPHIFPRPTVFDRWALLLLLFYFLIQFFKFEVVVDSHALLRIMQRDPCVCTLYLVSPKGNILHSHSTMSQPGYWHWHSPNTRQSHHHRYEPTSLSHSTPPASPWQPLIHFPIV